MRNKKVMKMLSKKKDDETILAKIKNAEYNLKTNERKELFEMVRS